MTPTQMNPFRILLIVKNSSACPLENQHWLFVPSSAQLSKKKQTTLRLFPIYDQTSVVVVADVVHVLAVLAEIQRDRRGSGKCNRVESP